MKHLSVLFILAIISIYSCQSTSKDDIGTFDAVVTGEVQDANDNPVSGVQILIESYTSECSNLQDEAISHGVVSTDTNGEFQRQVQKPVKDTLRCLILEVSPESSSGLKDTTVTTQTTLNLRATSPFDVERIEVKY